MSEQPEKTVTLTEDDRKFLSFALDQAADEMCNRDGFTDLDWALLERWRALTDPPAA
ncbi:hypothetical protein ACPCSE_29945 [Streptomyces cellulosae]